MGSLSTSPHSAHILIDGTAPSYFVECLLFNVPDECYSASVSDTYAAVVNYLSGNPIAGFACQNGQLSLFGPASTQWNVVDATAFVDALVNPPPPRQHCG